MAKMTGFKVYKGTKQTFIDSGKATANADAIVFITGGNDAKGSCIYAQGVYFANFAEFLAAINYVKGVNVGGQSYNAAQGGGYIAFGSKDPATVAVNAGEHGIEIGLSDAFVQKVNDTATALGSASDAAKVDGSAFARIANLAAIVSNLTGDSTESVASQITKAIGDLRTEIVGTLAEGDSATLSAINAELDGLDSTVGAIASDYLKSSDKTELGNRITTEAPVTITETAGTAENGLLKTYTFTQNGTTIGTINLAKDLVVTSGEVKMCTLEGVEVKCIELVLSSGDIVHIPVADLVDVYTTEANAEKVQITISDGNELSATIVSGAVTTTELADNAVTTAKIVDGNVTKEKLAKTVQDSLDKADAAAPQDTTYTKEEVNALLADYYTKAEVDAMWMWEEL